MNKRQQESKKPSTVELKSFKLHYDCDCERFGEDHRYFFSVKSKCSDEFCLFIQ